MLVARLSRRSLLAAGAALLAPRAAFAVSSTKALYQARTIVTGQRAETRIPGLERCIEEVLVRVSGDQRVAGHPDVTELARTPEAAVTHLYYRDLYAFRPIRDEQGTRDRPYEMTAEYDPAKIDMMLASLGSRPWLADRARLVVFLAARHIGSSYILDSVIDMGTLQRESFADASWKYAMDVVIPSRATLDRAELTFGNLPQTPLKDLAKLVDSSVGQIPLAGTLSWDRDLLGWVAGWRMAAGGKEHSWGIGGVNFDAAFRNAVGGAAQILSGNGAPA